MKEGEKNYIIPAILFAGFLFLFLMMNFSFTGKVIEEPPSISNCSNENIKSVWESIFQGSSDNITIIDLAGMDELTESEQEEWNTIFGGCPMYNAYQINGNNVRIIMGAEIWFIMDMKTVIALDAQYTTEAIENLTNSLNSTEGEPKKFLRLYSV